MKRLVMVLFFVAGVLSGCAQNYFNVPAENFAENVRLLGIAPIFIDDDSDIIHPQKDLLMPIISDLNRRYEPLLARKLQSTGNFYGVTTLADDPRQLFSTIMSRREKRDDASIEYNKYFWKNDAIGAYIKNNHIDAVMVVVISGLTKNSKIYSSNLLTSLENNFNFLTMTAQIIGSDGTVLWEYPNFRRQLLTYTPLVNLQYPDFSESEANLSRETAVRFKSPDGIRRTLEKKKVDLLFRETQEPEIYGKFFDDMTSLIKHSVEKKAPAISTIEGKQPTSTVYQPQKAVEPVNSLPTAVEPAAPIADVPVSIPVPKSSFENPDNTLTTPEEIVPAR